MQTQIHRILFPTDFSEPARLAQKYVMTLTEQFGAELHLLHVIPPLPVTVDVNMAWLPQNADQRDEIELAQKQLATEVESNWAEKHHTVSSAEVGFAVDEILRYASEHKIDLIVCGTHGRTGLSHVLLGSVAERLVRVAPCPVLTVHPGGRQFVNETSSIPEKAMVHQ
jgi:nucleotide-binding universal stress UspA family protein